MAQPEMQRQVRQQRADINSLYELTDQGFTELRERAGGLDTRIDALDTKVDDLDTRIDALDAKVDQGFTRVEQRFDTLSGQLAEVLRQLRAE